MLGKWTTIGRRTAGLLLLMVLVCSEGCPRALAADPRPIGIDGALILGGGGNLPKEVFAEFIKRAGGPASRIVVLSDGELPPHEWAAWKARHPAQMVKAFVLIADKDEYELMLKALRDATGVWIADADARVLSGRLTDKAAAKELQLLLKRGGVLGTTNDCGIVGKLLISDKKDKKTLPALELLPGTVLMPRFRDAGRSKRLFEVLDENPGVVGFGIEEGTALVMTGRELRVVGAAAATACLAASTDRKQSTITLKPGAEKDLVALRRGAIARTEPAFPPKTPATPEVAKGVLVLSGGETSREILERFIEAAGGPDASIVILPQAKLDSTVADVSVGTLIDAGARNVQYLRGRNAKEVDAPNNLEMLKKAQGIWIDGGRQWKLVDALEGTQAITLIRDLLKRGGAIGGGGAGASIQAEYLCRGDPIDSDQIMSEGYERGLGFLPGVAVDQHFSERKRFGDMTALMKTYPQLLGIGIDEATAIVVTGSTAEVIGLKKVYFYDRNKPAANGKPDYEAIKAGERYDLKTRAVLPAQEPRTK